jgi:hypothetical protein
MALITPIIKTRRLKMDKAAIVLQVIGLIPRFLPRPKPPTFDYSRLEARNLYNGIKIPGPAPFQADTTVHVTVPRVTSGETEKPQVGTACIACSRSHLSTVSGALNESLRFARDEGITSPEVQRRLMMAEDEINIMERIDLSAEALQKSPPEEAQVAREYLPRIRQLRQDIGQVASVDTLEKVAADATVLGQEFRLRALQLKGVDLNPVLALAKRVQTGEITMEEAKRQLKTLLPEEE